MKGFKIFVHLLILAPLVLGLAACGGGGGGSASPNSDANLSNLTLSAGAFSSAFQSTTTNYSLSVANAVDATTVTPTTSDPNASVAVNGVNVVSGAASASIGLTVGVNSITIVVTAEDNTTNQSYTVLVTRLAPPSSDANLSSLALSAGSLSSAFQSTTTDYSLSVASTVDASTVTPTTSDPNASVTVNGMSVVSGAASSSITLALGVNSITIVVIAEDGSTNQTYSVSVTRLLPSISSFELLDPTPDFDTFYGTSVIILANGNIVVTDPDDYSLALSFNGAVHLFDPYTQTLIASIYGDNRNDRLGSGGITALANNNFVIASPNDDENGILNAGSVRLVDGTTGKQIGTPLVGDNAGDFLGLSGITALANNNFVVASSSDDENGIGQAGSVRLVHGGTGIQIGATLAGDSVGDQLGLNDTTALANNNFVIVSSLDDEGGILNAGSVRLVDGDTGVQIGAALAGDFIEDQLGLNGISPLANNNFVIASNLDTEGGITDAGSVRLVDGTSGKQIGATIAGDIGFDALGTAGITTLANNNFVIASPNDDENGKINTGSVQLVNGTTGLQIGATLVGDSAGDFLGWGGTTALANNNFVITSPRDREGGISDAGSVRLVDGTTGVQIGITLMGDSLGDQLGSNGITALSNNNFVIASSLDNAGGILNAGSVQLVNGSTGVQIGATLMGDIAEDQLGLNGITALANNNFVITSMFDDESGIVNAGSVRLMDGGTGVQIGAMMGDSAGDTLGSGSITPLVSNNFVIVSRDGDEGGIVNAGSVRLADGITGAQIGVTIAGGTAFDLDGSTVLGSATDNFYILAAPFWDKNGLMDTGLVRLITE